jgi:hypothetical protein
MKQLLLIGLCSLGFQSFAQQFTIPKTTQPFYNIIEWKGMGAMLMSKDPSGNNNQLYLTLVADKDKSVWEQQIAPPKGTNYHYIASENARYVYFLRNLNPENGKIYFEQLNSAGNVKNTNVSLSSVIKSLGYEVTDLQLKNVVVTDKALVHHFRHYDKKEKLYTDIATFITHHNMLVYAAKLGTIKEDDLNSGRSNHFQYIGFSEDEIYFANYATKKEGKGWDIIKFNSKGKEIAREFIRNQADKFTTFQTTGYGTNGAYYLGTEKDMQNGLVTRHNGSYYFTILNTSNNAQTLELHQLVEGEWKKLNQHQLSTNNKKSFSVGIYPLNEAMTYKISGGDLGNKTLALFLDGKTATLNNFSEESIYNPSRALIDDKKGLFAVKLSTGELFFDKQQLKNGVTMEFEFIKK